MGDRTMCDAETIELIETIRRVIVKTRDKSNNCSNWRKDIRIQWATIRIRGRTIRILPRMRIVAIIRGQ